ncbi:MAG: hypothetical protein HY714_03075, partial [Candidatus Omnitrophica bacterium]|nr:hypothetical protein [Candidatus Omnitrophota bacterium]
MRQPKYNSLFHGFAYLTLFVFTSTSTLQAQGPLQIPVSAAAAERSLVAERFTLPQDLGTVQEQHAAGKDGLYVIFIQDAHVIQDAQSNIQSMIRYFQEKYGVGLVALEGGKGRLDPTLFRAFPDEGAKKRVLAGYLARGELTGAEMASIFGPGGGRFFGIEDWKLYEANYLAYLRSAQRREDILQDLAGLRAGLDEKRPSVYSPKFNEFHEKVFSFREEKIHFLQFLAYLKGLEAARPLMEKYGHLKTLLESIEEDSRLSRENIDVTLRDLADVFKRKHLRRMIKPKVMEFNSQYQDFVTGKIDSATFLKYLIQAADSVEDPISLTPAMEELLGHTETLATLKGTKIFDELEDLLEELEAGFAASEEERGMAARYRKILLDQDLARLELTKENYLKMKKNLGEYTGLLKDPGAFDPALEFYRLALERDRVLQQNLIGLMKKEKARSAVVLCGGFHSQGFSEGLRDAGVSYAMVTPRIRSLKGTEIYNDVMQGKLSYREYLETTFYDAFVKASTVKLVSELNEPDFKKVLKLWRDDVIRKLAEEGRVAASGEYTRYIDLLIRLYVDKFGSEGLTAKSPDQILADLSSGLKETRENFLGRLWEGFENQLKGFMEGAGQFVERKSVTAAEIETLLRNSAAGKPSNLQALRAVLDPEMKQSETEFFREIFKAEGSQERFNQILQERIAAELSRSGARLENVRDVVIIDTVTQFLQDQMNQTVEATRAQIDEGAAKAKGTIREFLQANERARGQLGDVAPASEMSSEFLGQLVQNAVSATGLPGNAAKVAALAAFREIQQEKQSVDAGSVQAAALGAESLLSAAAGIMERKGFSRTSNSTLFRVVEQMLGTYQALGPGFVARLAPLYPGTPGYSVFGRVMSQLFYEYLGDIGKFEADKGIQFTADERAALQKGIAALDADALQNIASRTRLRDRGRTVESRSSDSTFTAAFSNVEDALSAAGEASSAPSSSPQTPASPAATAAEVISSTERSLLEIAAGIMEGKGFSRTSNSTLFRVVEQMLGTYRALGPGFAARLAPLYPGTPSYSVFGRFMSQLFYEYLGDIGKFEADKGIQFTAAERAELQKAMAALDSVAIRNLADRAKLRDRGRTVESRSSDSTFTAAFSNVEDTLSAAEETKAASAVAAPAAAQPQVVTDLASDILDAVPQFKDDSAIKAAPMAAGMDVAAYVKETLGKAGLEVVDQYTDASGEVKAGVKRLGDGRGAFGDPYRVAVKIQKDGKEHIALLVVKFAKFDDADFTFIAALNVEKDVEAFRVAEKNGIDIGVRRYGEIRADDGTDQLVAVVKDYVEGEELDKVLAKFPELREEMVRQMTEMLEAFKKAGMTLWDVQASGFFVQIKTPDGRQLVLDAQTVAAKIPTIAKLIMNDLGSFASESDIPSSGEQSVAAKVEVLTASKAEKSAAADAQNAAPAAAEVAGAAASLGGEAAKKAEKDQSQSAPVGSDSAAGRSLNLPDVSGASKTPSQAGQVSSDAARARLQALLDKIRAKQHLSPAEASAQLDRFVDAVKGEKYRQGVTLNLPADKEVVLIGDLHASLDNLLKILENENTLERILKGEVVLVILGDAVHSEKRDQLAQMDTSV